MFFLLAKFWQFKRAIILTKFFEKKIQIKKLYIVKFLLHVAINSYNIERFKWMDIYFT